MPELPEVETVRRGLEKLIVGRKILNVKTLNEKSFQASANDVKAFVISAKIVAVRRRAKVLIIDLSTDYSLVIHLKMTGQIVFRTNCHSGLDPESTKKTFGEADQNWGGGHPNDSFLAELPDRSTRVEFDLSGIDGTTRKTVFFSDPLASKTSYAGQQAEPSRSETNLSVSSGIYVSESEGEKSEKKSFASRAKLFFNDQRKFGWIKLVPTAEVKRMDFMQKVGPEPLNSKNAKEKKVLEREFLKRIRRRNGSAVKAAILDQTTIAGIGNIYADEALWAAKVHPATRVRDLTDEQLIAILDGAISVMNLSLEKGGSTDRNYVDAEGKKGSYLNFAKVFRREGQPCPRCGAEIEKIRVAGRGTHICPRCQVKVV